MAGGSRGRLRRRVAARTASVAPPAGRAGGDVQRAQRHVVVAAALQPLVERRHVDRRGQPVAQLVAAAIAASASSSVLVRRAVCRAATGLAAATTASSCAASRPDSRGWQSTIRSSGPSTPSGARPSHRASRDGRVAIRSTAAGESRARRLEPVHDRQLRRGWSGSPRRASRCRPRAASRRSSRPRRSRVVGGQRGSTTRDCCVRPWSVADSAGVPLGPIEGRGERIGPRPGPARACGRAGHVVHARDDAGGACRHDQHDQRRARVRGRGAAEQVTDAAHESGDAPGRRSWPGIVASRHARTRPRLAVRSAARRLVETMPKAELHLHLDGSAARRHGPRAGTDTRVSTHRATGSGCSARSSARCRCTSPGRAPARVRPADRPDAGRRGARADHGRAGRGEGRRARALRRDPLGSTAPRRPAGCPSPTGSRPCAGAPPRRPLGPARRPAHLHRAALARPGRNVVLAETAARFIDQGLIGWDLAGPEAGIPRPAGPCPLIRGGPGERAADHDPRRGVGRRGPGPARARRRPGADRPRPGAIEDAELCAELRARGMTLDLCPTSNWQAGIVPSVADHPLGPLLPGGRAGHAQHGRHDRVRHHAVRGVRPGRRADRAVRCPSCGRSNRHALDVAFADESDAGAAARRVRYVGGGRPGASAERLVGGEHAR